MKYIKKIKSELSFIFSKNACLVLSDRFLEITDDVEKTLNNYIEKELTYILLINYDYYH